MRNRRLTMIVAGLITLAMVPMTATASSGAEGSAGHQDSVTEVTLVLDWTPNVNHVGIFVARDRGFFEAQGLDVQIIEPGEVWATSAVAGGQADFGIDFQESMTMLRADEVPLVSIATILQTNTSGFAVRAGEGITSPGEFAGLTYGTFNSPFEAPTLSALVTCEGGVADGINFVTAGMDLLAMLQQEQADLVWIYYGTQGFQAQRLGIDIDYFPLNDYPECIPDYYTPVVIASEQTIQDRPEMTGKFVTALRLAHEFVIQNPEEAARTLAEAVGELDEAELLQSVPWVAQYMKMESPFWGFQDPKVWQLYADWLTWNDVLAGPVDTTGASTNRFILGE